MTKQAGGLNVAKLRKMSKDLGRKAGGGDDLFLYANKLGEEDDVRILPPPVVANGVYFLEQEGWWINGKFYISNSTEVIGGVDVIQEELDLAKGSDDKDVQALVTAKKNGMPIIKRELRYLIPILKLDVEWSDSDELIKCDVSSAHILVAKPTLLTDIHNIVTGRGYQNGTPNGLADRVKGYNITLSKTGKGINTKYSANGWTSQTEMPEEWYDEKKMPNAFEINKKMAKSDIYLRSIIRNYLYGEEIIEDADTHTEESKKAITKASKPVVTKSQPSEEVVTKRATKKAVAEDSQESEPSRSLLEDAESSAEDEDNWDDV